MPASVVETFAKIGCGIIASNLVNAVMSNLPDDQEIDVEIEGQKIRLRNGMTWEEQRIFHHAVVQMVASEEWPTPKIAVGKSFGNVIEEIAPMLGGKEILGSLVQKLLGKLTDTIAAPSGAEIPNPGA